MKIPDSIRIDGIDYKIAYKPDLNNGHEMCYGRIYFEESVIELMPNRQDHQRECITLWHEILHGITEAKGLELGDDEEKIVDAFARGVYQVLQDNGRKLFDIVPPKEE